MIFTEVLFSNITLAMNMSFNPLIQVNDFYPKGGETTPAEKKEIVLIP